jgi:signal transduction histidine kinase
MDQQRAEVLFSVGGSTHQPCALVVDDEAAIRRGFGRCLEQHGYLVATAPDAESALADLASRSFDVIVSDITMPGMSGIDLLGRMRAMKLDAPVILVTGNPDLETAVKALEHQVLRYLAKPVSLADLARVVGEVVRLHGIARAKRLALDNEGLRSLVDELTRSKEAALAGTRAKAEFLSKMGHELRTPMTSIVGGTDCLLEGDLTTQQRVILEGVASAAGSLMGTIADVLEVAALDRSSVQLEARKFDVRAAVGFALESLAGRAAAKNLSMTSVVKSSVPSVLIGAGDRLGQALKYLVDNAIKFTKEGRIEVRVEADHGPGRCVSVRVAVSDTGVGMPAEALSRVVEAFAQGDNSSTREYGGSGLGLTIASQLVRLMGGAVDIESQPNVGTTVRFVARFEDVPEETDFFFQGDG